MNTQNNERDNLLNLLAATSQGGDSHTIRTHLENRFGDQEILDAVIDYASALAKAKTKAVPESPNDQNVIWANGETLFHPKTDTSVLEKAKAKVVPKSPNDPNEIWSDKEPHFPPKIGQ